MALGHKDSRRPGRRVFQPTVDGRLETRVLLSSSALKIQTAAGGQAVVVTEPNGQQFFVSVTHGTIQGTPASNDRINLIARGTNSNSRLEINGIVPNQFGGAHKFNSNLAAQTGILNIASINVTSGFINSIEGYRDSVLSGPLTVAGTSAVNRIAFTSIDPGGSIKVGEDLDTLDILNSATFTTAPGLTVGRDLNWFNVNGNLTFESGGSLSVGRDISLTAQPAKGSGPSGQGLFVGGNFTVTAPSTATISRFIDPPGILVFGNFAGVSRFTVGQVKGSVNVLGTITP